MQGEIYLTINHDVVAKISADDNPQLFIDLIAASRGDVAAASVITGSVTQASAKASKRDAALAKYMHGLTEPKAAPTTDSAPPSQQDLRRPSARDALDEYLLSLIKGAGWIRLERMAIHDLYTPAQLRASVHRLVKSKKLRRRGQARATEYMAP